MAYNSPIHYERVKTMKHTRLPAVLLAALLLAGCGADRTAAKPTVPASDMTQIVLSDSGITVDGTGAGTDDTAAVYTANDIVYYEAGKDFTYGEGSEADAHTPEEAAAHTVVHITQPGTYAISGRLSLGQIAVDLGSDAKKDPEAVVTLVLNGVDITCEVAPAVIFYNVYECGDDDPETAAKDVDTFAAGANVVIADGTVNTVSGAYVARIYDPESVVLNADKTAVEDASKLHKYDGAFYSRRSMNIYGGEEDSGVLQINAQNEGLDSEMHLTIHGGDIRIASGNDGINTNEDGVSVTTVNGGSVTIRVTGETGEGDGIDSNGWLVINGGTVMASACADSGDAGIDSDMGIHINGGTVIASGHMLDRIEDGGQTYGVFSFAGTQTGGQTIALTDGEGKTILETAPENAYSVLIFSSPDLLPGTYTLSRDGQTLIGSSGGMMGGHGMGPDGMEPPGDGQQLPEDFVPGQGQRPPAGEMPPEDFTRPQEGGFPEDFTLPEGETLPAMPEGFGPGRPGANGGMGGGEPAADFVIRDGGNMFGGITDGAETEGMMSGTTELTGN